MPVDFTGIAEGPKKATGGIDFTGIDGVDFAGVESPSLMDRARSGFAAVKEILAPQVQPAEAAGLAPDQEILAADHGRDLGPAGLAASFGSGVNTAAGSFSRGLDEIATFISKKTGLPKGGLFENAAKEYQENADYWNKAIQETGADALTQLMGKAAGGAVPGIAEFALGPVYYGIKGGAEASNRGESTITGAARGAGERYLSGKVLGALNMLKMGYRVPAMAGFGAAQAAAEGGNVPEGAGTMALYGFMGRGGVGFSDLTRPAKERAADIYVRAKARMSKTAPPPPGEGGTALLPEAPVSATPSAGTASRPGAVEPGKEAPVNDRSPEGVPRGTIVHPEERRAPEGDILRQHIDDLVAKVHQGDPAARQELHDTLMVDKISGAHTQRAYDILEKAEGPAKFVLSTDVKGLHSIDTKLGQKAGDDYLRALGKAYQDEGIPVYRYGEKSDEFLSRFDTAQEANEAQKRVDNRFRNSILEVPQEDGTSRYFTNLEFYTGIGGHDAGKNAHDNAFKNLYEAKRIAKTETGYDREALPANLVELSPEDFAARQKTGWGEVSPAAQEPEKVTPQIKVTSVTPTQQDTKPVVSSKEAIGETQPPLPTELHSNPFLNPRVVIPKVREALSALGRTNVVDGLKRGFAAVTREGASPAADILSENISRSARGQDVFEHGMEEATRLFSKSSPLDNADFMQHADTDNVQRTRELQIISDRLKQMWSQKADEIRALGTGALEQVRENYFPHIWKKPGEVSEIIKALSRRPMEGSKRFLKQRVFEDVREGLANGFKPVSDNPIDLAVLKMMEMDKYIITHKTFAALKESGEVKFFRPSEKPGPEYERIDDKYATVWRPIKDAEGNVVGRTPAGNYYAKGPTAQVLNNYLSQNLYNNKYVGSLFKAYMGAANSLNQFQLGVGSAFHAGFTSLETVMSQNALGLRQLTEGRFLDAAKSFGKAPTAWVTNLMRGNKLVKEWRQPGSQGQEMAQIIESVVAAGGRKEALRGERFQTDATKKMLEAWHRGTAGGKAEAALRSPFALVEQTARPIMEWLVPRQKFGVFGELMNDWLKQHPGASHEEMRTAARQFWNRVDSRLGQVIYDRLFANNVAKNVAQGLIRAPGWTGGTILEVGGGVKDLAAAAGNVLEGKRPVLTDRAAYTLSLLMTTAIINGALTYAFTGDKPKDKDFWAFRTGRKNPDGSDERFMIPTYAKDIAAYRNAPLTTLGHKTHPLLSVGIDIAKNKDYYGNQVRDEDADYLTQLAQTGKYMVKQYEPFWTRGARKAEEQGKSFGAIAAPLIGVMPAPKHLTQTDAEKLADKYMRANLPAGGRTLDEQLTAQARRDIRIGQPGEEDRASEAFLKGDITTKQYKDILKNSGKKPLERIFGRLTPSQARKVYAVATPEEKELLENAMTKKLTNEMRNKPFKVEDSLDEETKDQLKQFMSEGKLSDLEGVFAE